MISSINHLSDGDGDVGVRLWRADCCCGWVVVVDGLVLLHHAHLLELHFRHRAGLV